MRALEAEPALQGVYRSGRQQPTADGQSGPVARAWLDGADEMSGFCGDIEDDQAVKIRRNFGDCALAVGEVEQAAKSPLPLRGKIKNKAEALALHIIRVVAQEITGLVGIGVNERGHP